MVVRFLHLIRGHDIPVLAKQLKISITMALLVILV